jgi:hypothetical protein
MRQVLHCRGELGYNIEIEQYHRGTGDGITKYENQRSGHMNDQRCNNRPHYWSKMAPENQIMDLAPGFQEAAQFFDHG